jgi:uncharacterized protein YciI
MPIFAVELAFDKDEARRLERRPSHRERLKDLYDEGVLVMSGPFADDSGALLILRAESQDALLRILDDDPYTHDDVVTRANIREWAPIFGPTT